MGVSLDCTPKVPERSPYLRKGSRKGPRLPLSVGKRLLSVPKLPVHETLVARL